MRSINLTDTPGGHTEGKDSAADQTGNGYKLQLAEEIGCRARVGPLMAAAAVIHLHSSISVGRLKGVLPRLLSSLRLADSLVPAQFTQIVIFPVAFIPGQLIVVGTSF